jgi:hypothetical protein
MSKWGPRVPPQTIHLQNTGTTVLTFNSVQATVNSAQTNTCQPSVAVGGNCDIKVTFNPSAIGPLTGTLTVSTNAAGPPYVVDLSGTGILPAPKVSPESLTFNNQSVGTTSDAQQVTVTNNGAIALHITSFEISKGWRQSNNCLPSLAPHASCTINVSFEPTSSGPLNGVLTFTDYAEGSPQTVTLNGTGRSMGLSISPDSLSYAGQSVSTTSAAQSITVTNNNNVVVTSLTIAPSGDFAQTNNCADSLAANASCTINVTFTPTATGNRTGTLMLRDSAANSPQSVNLSGTGTGGAAIWLSTSSVTFPNQSVGTRSASPQVTLQNTGALISR